MRKIDLNEMLKILFQDISEKQDATIHKFLVQCEKGYCYVVYVDLENNSIGLINDEILPFCNFGERDIYLEEVEN